MFYEPSDWAAARLVAFDLTRHLDSGRVSAQMLTHRLANVTHADRIIVMHDGALVEAGSHDDLMNADSYEITFTSNGTKKVYKHTPDPSWKPAGMYQSVDVDLDPCTSYMVTVASKNNRGEGSTTRPRLEPALRPGSILGANANRWEGGTTATFWWKPPTMRGYAGIVGYPQKPSATRQVFLDYDVELVRMSDNKVIRKERLTGGYSSNSVNYPVSGLDPKRAYTLRVKTINEFGGCDSKIGRILLNRVK
ncbi:hypothetical protein [Actinoplanes sp. NPDC051859]|uniref:hypothetical protein n=1 Tax=Actinoplanes sp. NPDC051859 TaxID=3363909 RepID=UPI00378E13AA